MSSLSEIDRKLLVCVLTTGDPSVHFPLARFLEGFHRREQKKLIRDLSIAGDEEEIPSKVIYDHYIAKLSQPLKTCRPSRFSGRFAETDAINLDKNLLPVFPKLVDSLVFLSGSEEDIKETLDFLLKLELKKEQTKTLVPAILKEDFRFLVRSISKANRDRAMEQINKIYGKIKRIYA